MMASVAAPHQVCGHAVAVEYAFDDGATLRGHFVEVALWVEGERR